MTKTNFKALAIGQSPNQACQIMIDGMSEAVLMNFRKLGKHILDKGIMKIGDKTTAFDIQSLVVGVYMGLMRAATLEGMADVDKVIPEVNMQLIDLIQNSRVAKSPEEAVTAIKDIEAKLSTPETVN